MAEKPPFKPKKKLYRIGRYVLRAELGRGGMGTVYLGYDPRVERDVAIKVLPREFLHDPMFQARFEREAKTIALLDHPAVVPIHDYGREAGQPYLVMRYMGGGTLSDRLRVSSLSVPEVIQILRRVGPALDEAHKRGIYHRDIKPSNILFDKYGHSYLSDFGMVRLEESAAELTGSHAAVGTPGYMSPEQVRGVNLDSRSDIYGVGVLIFQMLTGKRPFVADTPAMVIVKQMSGPVPSICDYRPELAKPYEELVRRMMSKKPANRPYTAAEVIDLLVAAVAKVEQGDSEPPKTSVQPAAPTAPAEEVPTPVPTTIMRAISDPPPLTPPPQTMSLGIHDIETLSERDIIEQISDATLEIHCPNCNKVIDIYGQHDPIKCTHCKHEFHLEGHLCPNCFTFHTERATLCSICDTPLTRVCPECLTTNWAGAESCKSCHITLDIFAILQLPGQHAPAARLRRTEKQMRKLRQVEEQVTEVRMARLSEEQTEVESGGHRRGLLLTAAVITFVLLAIMLLLVLGDSL